MCGAIFASANAPMSSNGNTIEESHKSDRQHHEHQGKCAKGSNAKQHRNDQRARVAHKNRGRMER